MIALFYFVVAVLAAPFKPKSRLEAGNAVLRHQLIGKNTEIVVSMQNDGKNFKILRFYFLCGAHDGLERLSGKSNVHSVLEHVR
jgi:hypothetical protein